MAAELRKLGATVVEGNDYIEVSPPTDWQPAAIHTYDDHRMAMCLSLAAFNPLVEPGSGAGAHPRPEVRGQDLPRLLRDAVRRRQAEPDHIPVITVDGPTASGKGTLAAALAARLGWHQLDSGLLYRVTALAAQREGVSPDDEARPGPGRRRPEPALRRRTGAGWDGIDVAADLRLGTGGGGWPRASPLWARPCVARCRGAAAGRVLPGLVADGRDMGTVIFPDAPLKVVPTASPVDACRAPA